MADAAGDERGAVLLDQLGARTRAGRAGWRPGPPSRSATSRRARRRRRPGRRRTAGICETSWDFLVPWGIWVATAAAGGSTRGCTHPPFRRPVDGRVRRHTTRSGRRSPRPETLHSGADLGTPPSARPAHGRVQGSGPNRADWAHDGQQRAPPAHRADPPSRSSDAVTTSGCSRRAWSSRSPCSGCSRRRSHPLWQRMGFVRDLVPGLVMHTARPTLVLVSVILLLTARGLRRGHRLAWIATIATLAVSTFLHLAKGPDVLSAVVGRRGGGVARGAGQGVPGAADAARRSAGRSSGWSRPSSSSSSCSSAWPCGCSWSTRRTRRSTASATSWHRSRTLLTVVFVVVLLWSLLSPRRPRRLSPADHRDERERARLVVQQHGGGTLDYFALRDDKDWFFSGSSVVAHSVRGGVCLVSPDPIGPPEEKVLAWAEFLDYADDFGWSVAVVGAAADWLPEYESSGLRTVYLGDEAIVDCPTFSLARALAQVAAAGRQPDRPGGLRDELPRPGDHRPDAAGADRGDERRVPAGRHRARVLDDALAAVPARRHRPACSR